MRVIIAEKPSLGRLIAAGIGGSQTQGDGLIRTREATVTWCFGHLLELAAPEHYDPKWKKWELETLPITIEPDDWHLQPKEDAKAQLRVLRRLLADATEVVNAGDPDREGQMLVDEVLDYLEWKGKTRRLLLHDTTPQSVRAGLAAMRPNGEFANLYAAAKCRSRADWLVGMNLTRAASKRIGLTASIGRVQTPTLALIVRRDQEIDGHKSSAFYTLHAHVTTAADALVMSHETEHDRILDKKEAQRIAAALSGQPVDVSVSEKRAVERAPLPHTLQSFHKEGEKLYGWSASKALKVLQGLYEKQLVSYPRTDCPYLPREQAALAVPMVKAILAAGNFERAATAVHLLAPSDRVYDDKKVAEHHGLTPTNRLPGAELDADARKGWEIVTGRFIQSLLPDYAYMAKVATFTYESRLFKASGEAPLNASESWRLLSPKVDRDGKPIEPLRLSVGNGEVARGRAGKVDVKEGKTTPPKPYTEASLIEDMCSVHKFVTDPRIKGLLKENAGIGTPATQAAIIETLKARQYVVEQKPPRGKITYIRSTEFGRYLIANIPPTLADPGVTALWEEQLNSIAGGSADAAEFMQHIDRYVAKHLERIRSREFPPAPEAKPVAKSTTRVTKRARRAHS